MQLHLLRHLCLFGLPILLASSWLLTLHRPDHWQNFADGFFVICLTANIGYFTNFIAIKMLFKPYQKTALGRQGLIPKNQKKLAKALSNTLSDHFLASEHWQEYINKANIYPKLLDSGTSFAKNWLDHSENQQQLKLFLVDQLEQNKSSIDTLLEKIQNDLLGQLEENFDPQQLLEQSFKWFDSQLKDNPREMEFLIEPIIKTVAANVPMIATRLVATIDEHIERQDTLRRGVAKAAKWSANFSEEDIKGYLFRMVASFEFRQTLFEGLQTLVSEYQSLGKLPTQKLNLRELFHKHISKHLDSLDLSGKLIDYVKAIPANRLSHGVNLILPNLIAAIKNKLEDKELQQKLNQQLINMIEHIDLREVIEEKATTFSPQKMEQIFHNMIADQLVFIELLGAVLGGLSGLALVNFGWFVGLTALGLSYLLVDKLLTNHSGQNGSKDSRELVIESTQSDH
ncbi:MAG: DUF445 domain-containing protein [Kangiellaceae bacterium]|nr:DUF445 domain-containing protein [Kangiellaceae bacterium]MCW9016202.1 DUF445 domain-containing protein [Kangiellaceae bacterium]